jgi:hypothetical protein
VTQRDAPKTLSLFVLNPVFSKDMNLERHLARGEKEKKHAFLPLSTDLIV